MPLWRRWQSLVAILLFFLNVDYIIMPLLQWAWRVEGWSLFWCASLFATAELVYWNEYAKWLLRHTKRTEPVLRTARALFTLRRFCADAWNWFLDRAQSHSGEDDPVKQRALKGAIDLIKHTHIWVVYPMMLGLGLMPLGWAFGIVIQRVLRTPGSFVVLLVANAVKTYLLGMLYLLLPWWAKVLLLLVIASIVVWQIHRLTQKGPRS